MSNRHNRTVSPKMRPKSLTKICGLFIFRIDDVTINRGPDPVFGNCSMLKEKLERIVPLKDRLLRH